MFSSLVNTRFYICLVTLSLLSTTCFVVEMSAKIVQQYQIPLPFTLEEHEIGKLYSVAEASKEETGGGEGIEIIVNEPYEGEKTYHGKGQYTHKIFHVAKKVPKFIRLLAPKGSLEIHEKSWNAYPFSKTVYSNPDYMKDGFYIVIKTVHKPGRADDKENTNAQPFSGKPIVIDIVNDPIDPRDYREDEDPSKCHSTKTGRGPLSKDWRENQGDYPMMTSFKHYEIEFKWFGLQRVVESRIQKFVRRLLIKFHRQMFCWMDRWHGMTMEEIRKMEDETKMELDKLRSQGEVKGMKEQ